MRHMLATNWSERQENRTDVTRTSPQEFARNLLPLHRKSNVCRSLAFRNQADRNEAEILLVLT